MVRTEMNCSDNRNKTPHEEFVGFVWVLCSVCAWSCAVRLVLYGWCCMSGVAAGSPEGGRSVGWSVSRSVGQSVGLSPFLFASVLLVTNIGVVGLNGSGKSTLLKIMAGVDTEFDGTARPLPGASIGYLSQEPQLSYATVQENIDQAVASSRAILDEYATVGTQMADPNVSNDEMTVLMERAERLTDQIEASNLWELDRMVQRAMDALRVPPSNALVSNLSGGEKRRVALCRLLLENHDMLLLDEPTNHLDAESVAWLEQYLANFAGTVVCITHDRYFLENVAKWILELDRGVGIPFEGNYSAWLAAKNQRLEDEKKEQSAAAKAVQAELNWIRSSRKSSQSKARLNRYEELLVAAAPKELRSAGQIYIPPGPRLGDVVIEVENVQKSLGDRLLMNDLTFSLPPAGIVGVIGPNGA